MFTLDYKKYMIKSRDSRYPDNDHDLEAYSNWKAGEEHMDCGNSGTLENR